MNSKKTIPDFEAYFSEMLSRCDRFKSNKRFFTVNGYDAGATLLSSLREGDSPVVMLEDTCDGVLACNDGFLDTIVPGVWIMERVKAADAKARKAALSACKAAGFDMIRRIIADRRKNPVAEAFDYSRTSYFPRGPSGNHYWGYEFVLTFKFDTDMTL